jgi:hypothetical protein
MGSLLVLKHTKPSAYDHTPKSSKRIRKAKLESPTPTRNLSTSNMAQGMSRLSSAKPTPEPISIDLSDDNDSGSDIIQTAPDALMPVAANTNMSDLACSNSIVDVGAEDPASHKDSNTSSSEDSLFYDADLDDVCLSYGVFIITLMFEAYYSG